MTIYALDLVLFRSDLQEMLVLPNNQGIKQLEQFIQS